MRCSKASYHFTCIYLFCVLPAERQKRFDALAAGHRGSVICSDIARSAINTPTSVFQHTNPQPKEVALTRWRNKRCAAVSGAQSFGFAKCSSLPPLPLACFLLLTSSATTSLHVRCWSRGVPLSQQLFSRGFANGFTSAPPEPRFSCGAVWRFRWCAQRHYAAHSPVRYGCCQHSQPSAQLHAATS